MKKPPSKTDLRERLQRQTAAFLSSGGKVKEFRAGESAYDRKENRFFTKQYKNLCWKSLDQTVSSPQDYAFGTPPNLSQNIYQ